MKYIVTFLVFLIVTITGFSFIGTTVTYAGNSLFNNTTTEIPYKASDYGLEKGIKAVENLNDQTNEKDAATYVGKVTAYILSFVYFIAVILIIYAGFNLLTGVGDEEKAKKSKTMIIYVILGIIIMFLAGPIIKFVITALDK